MSGGIIINRVLGQLAVIDNPAAGIYTNLSAEQKAMVEEIRGKEPGTWTNMDWQVLLDICSDESV